jgi:AraC family transcriptional regulator
MDKNNIDKQIEITNFKETTIAVLEHRGDPALLEKSIEKFIKWRKEAGLTPDISATFNILYNDPYKVVPEHFRLDIGTATKNDIKPNDMGIALKIIPAGRCARLRYIGIEEGFVQVLSYLYTDWLPQSGERLRDFPLYCQRVSFTPFVAKERAITDIFLPLM